MFKRKADAFPPANRISESKSVPDVGLYTFKTLVAEPTVVKTVSNKSVSAENFNRAPESLLYNGFLLHALLSINKAAQHMSIRKVVMARMNWRFNVAKVLLLLPNPLSQAIPIPPWQAGHAA
jgi:hypothetical protein